MNTKQIDYCIELAKTENFSRGAENMFVSQPTFSYQIKILEEEVGFRIFERNGKGATLTPAGQQFVTYLTKMREEMKRAIEQGQNFSAKYKDNITISLMVRQAVYFQYDNGMDSFLKNESDILFALKEQAKQLAGVSVHELFESHIYLIVNNDDPLADKSLITEEDLFERTLMVGGGSPPALRSVQQKLISSGKISYFNSPDHDTTLTNVAARRGVCLAPGFLNDHSNQFSWIPFDCKQTFSCVLLTHKNDHRESLRIFLSILRQLYQEAVTFPL